MTRTSMPRCRTSTASPAAKAERKDFVPAYRAVKGEQMAAAAEDVKTIAPRLSAAIYVTICKQAVIELRSQSFFTVASFGSSRL